MGGITRARAARLARCNIHVRLAAPCRVSSPRLRRLIAQTESRQTLLQSATKRDTADNVLAAPRPARPASCILSRLILFELTTPENYPLPGIKKYYCHITS
ncbi:hypothetical protein EVAR_23861_1 [Eumeta japonica]|uniref:Uncharacterized protein n=1 Tax=Eumeta variegata TaxID=151549 RepID=A0A4C1V3S6_EUMVA|nr:hypothetical protein EVAR_23861_1 [Eumeta japonica]